ncbi:MAG: DUF547 domain-containing protein [Sphingomonadaceae bacterium]|nr:MAG: DUF547 domain-containing protein [Sphingomonadaceae bacterium]
MARLVPFARYFALAATLAMTSALPANAQEPGDQAGFEQFVPSARVQATSIDYTVWDDALKYMVFRMGRSSRQAAATPEPGTGSRRTWGHTSRYRLEGNRVIFSFLERDIIDSLTAYKQDLEATANTIDIAALPRNEQLAFWINLHNATVIEQLAQEYPVRSPSLSKFGPDEVPLDDAKVITIRGVAMSPKDIRTRIVYPNWSDPKVIYGFFRGEIGGPSIMSEAYTARNVSRLLEDGARDFINSLRAVEKRGSTMHVSMIYQEAAPFHFNNWDADLRAHIGRYARDEVAGIVETTDRADASLYETDIADLANGQREPTLSYVLEDTGGLAGATPASARVPRSVARLVLEQRRKINELIRRKELTPRVIVIDMQNPDKDGYIVE